MFCHLHNKYWKILWNPQKVGQKNVEFVNFVISAKIVKSASQLEGFVVICITKSEKNCKIRRRLWRKIVNFVIFVASTREMRDAASRLSRLGWFSHALAFRSFYYLWGKTETTRSLPCAHLPYSTHAKVWLALDACPLEPRRRFVTEREKKSQNSNLSLTAWVTNGRSSCTWYRCEI